MFAHWGDIARELLLGGANRKSIPNLDGPWRPNEVLENCLALSPAITGLDGLAVDNVGTLYASAGRQIVSLSGESFDRVVEIADLPGVVSGITWSSNLGLVAAVAGTGVVTIDRKGRQRVLPTGGVRGLHAPTDVAADTDGRVYVTDGSSENSYEDWVRDLMTKGATGRLICYSPDGNHAEVLAEKLAFPIGVSVDPSTGSAIVAEAWRHRLQRHQGGAVETLLENLPGYPTRLTPDSDGGWWLTLFAMRTHLVEFVLRETEFRKRMIETIDPSDWVAPSISPVGSPLQPVQLGALHTHGIKKPWAPPRSYGIVAQLDSDFRPIRSFHSRSNGQRHGTSGVAVHAGTVFVASRATGLILAVPGDLQSDR